MNQQQQANALKLDNMTPLNLLNEEQTFTGFVYISSNVYSALRQIQNGKLPIYLKIKDFIFTSSPSQKFADDQIGIGKIHRQILKVALTEKLSLSQYIPRIDQNIDLAHLNLEIEAAQLKQGKLEAKEEEIEKIIREKYKGTFLQPGAMFIFSFFDNVLLFKVNKTSLADLGFAKQQNLNNVLGILTDDTVIEIDGKNTPQFRIISKVAKTQSIFDQDFKLEKLGVGGLDQQLITIFRRAFASRRFPPEVLKKYGISHVKGVLLYGPPGTGKTLIARQLAKVLKAKEPKIVNGPEIMSKYVGQAEENIRKLFEEAIQDQKMLGDDSQLHIIIFDELDSICRQRGTINSGTGVHDTMVNQLLSMIDGVDALNNVLVIGMTNRKDLIDEAILRPGRFEVHIEVNLPDEDGREQIFKIHTSRIFENQLMGKDVNLSHLAQRTKNYTGAEIEAVVKQQYIQKISKIQQTRSACAFSFTRGHDLLNFNIQTLNIKDQQIEMADFEQALQEIKPQFGIDSDKLQVLTRNKLFNYGDKFQNIQSLLNQSIEQVVKGQSCHLHSILLEGKSGSGTTAIAAHYALNCKFPFVKLISAENFVGYTDNGKINVLVKIFDDAYKSPHACIVIDCIERIIEFIDVGPRFNNSLLQALLVLIKKVPSNPNNRLLIIATTSQASTLKDLEILKSFDIILNIPLLSTTNEIGNVLIQFLGNSSQSNQQQIAKIANSIKEISIKKLILIADMATKGESNINYDEFDKCFRSVMMSDLY